MQGIEKPSRAVAKDWLHTGPVSVLSTAQVPAEVGDSYSLQLGYTGVITISIKTDVLTAFGS